MTYLKPLKVHLRRPGAPHLAACGYERRRNMTADPERVTCLECRRVLAGRKPQDRRPLRAPETATSGPESRP